MVEYCSPVAVTLINQLESVQRRFTKRLYTGISDVTVQRALCFTGTRPSGASSITCNFNSMLQGLVLLSPDSFFHVYLQFKNTRSFI